MTLDEFLSLEAAKQHLRIGASGSDDLINAHRAAAAKWIEVKTGRNILDRTATVRERPKYWQTSGHYLRGRESDRVAQFRVSDAKVPTEPVPTRYRPASAGNGASREADDPIAVARITVESDCVLVDPPEAGWPEEFSPAVPREIDIAVGMAPDARGKETLAEAARILVREYYDGTGAEQIASHSALNAILAAYQRPYSHFE